MYTSEIALICTIGYQTSLFSSSLVVVVLQYRQAYLENKVRYRDETLYNDGNNCSGTWDYSVVLGN